VISATGADGELEQHLRDAATATGPVLRLTLTNVAAHDGRLVAVGSNGSIATSTGGSRWQVRSTGVRHDLRGVV
jgi:hypothetical protein